MTRRRGSSGPSLTESLALLVIGIILYAFFYWLRHQVS